MPDKTNNRRLVKRPYRMVYNLERDTLERLHALAERASEVVKRENERVQVRSRDRLITYSEIVRTGLRVYLDAHRDRGDEIAQFLRPYLGREKPGRARGVGERESGAVFEERYLTGLVIEMDDKHDVDALVDRVNLVVRDANRRLEFKKDHDPEVNASEIYREAVQALLEAYEARPEQLAHDLRPLLGKNKT